MICNVMALRSRDNCRHTAASPKSPQVASRLLPQSSISIDDDRRLVGLCRLTLYRGFTVVPPVSAAIVYISQCICHYGVYLNGIPDLKALRR